MNVYEYLDVFFDIARIYRKFPESKGLFNDLIDEFNDKLEKDIEYHMRRVADPLKFVDDNFSKFLKNPTYLELFSSLRTLKEKVDKNEIVPNAVNDVSDGTNSPADSNED